MNSNKLKELIADVMIAVISIFVMLKLLNITQLSWTYILIPLLIDISINVVITIVDKIKEAMNYKSEDYKNGYDDGYGRGYDVGSYVRNLDSDDKLEMTYNDFYSIIKHTVCRTLDVSNMFHMEDKEYNATELINECEEYGLNFIKGINEKD